MLVVATHGLWLQDNKVTRVSTRALTLSFASGSACIRQDRGIGFCGLRELSEYDSVSMEIPSEKFSCSRLDCLKCALHL